MTVSLDLNGADLSAAVAEIAKQTRWDVYVSANLSGKVTLKVDTADGETVLKQAVEQCRGCWLRLYLIERPSDQRPARTAEKLIEFLTREQRDRFLNMPFERQQAELLRNMVAGRRDMAGGQGGNRTAGQPGQKFAWDPLRMLRAGELHDRISVSLKDAGLLDALDALWGASGHPVATEEEVATQVTLEAKDEQLEDVLDKVCQPRNLKWRRAYLVVALEELTREQLEPKINEGWNMMWDTFFTLDAPTRQQWLQWGITMLKSIPPDQAAQIRQSEFAPRMVEAATRLVTRLTPQQRREVAPLAQVLLSVFGGQ